MALDPSIVLLIGAEVSVVDESSYARTLTLAGNVVRITTQFKYGVASVSFDGAGDAIQVPISTDFDFGADNFTVEGWFRFVTKNDSQGFMGHWDNGGSTTNCGWFLWITGSKLTFTDAVGAASHSLDVIWAPTLGQWYHVAADRSGTTLRLYVDGVVVASNTSFTDTINSCTHPFTIGTIGVTGAFSLYDYNGQMDEIRITKGIAQYAGPFTPPSGPFSRGLTGESIQVVLIS